MDEMTEKQEQATRIIEAIGTLKIACLRHKTNNMGYLQWHEWADNKIKRGAKQKQCPKCGKWYFLTEY